MIDTRKTVIFWCVFTILFVSFGYSPTKTKTSLKVKSRNKSSTPFVIVFSYMRSGSSFVGELFNQNKEVFYVYEPLQLGRPEYFEAYVDGDRIILPNLRQVNVTQHQKQWVSSILENVSKCQLSNLTGIYTECVTDPKSTKGSRRCPKMIDVCARTTRKATKLVRATMEEIEYFLSRNKDIAEDIKILHLLRDPRGRLNSLLRYHEPLRIHHLSQDTVSTACERQMKDVRIRKQLEKQFPDMFLEISYEDVASDPVTMANRIYQFAYSQDVPDKVKQWIEKNRESGNGRAETKDNTFRKNSTTTALAWRHQLSAKDKSLIDKQCHALLHHMKLL